MSDLRKQLEQAKLLSKKDTKRLEHEGRVKRKQVGREGLEQEQKDRQQELQQKREDDRHVDRRRQKEIEQERKKLEEIAACRALLENETWKPDNGRATWFFELPDGRLPHLKLQDQERHQLEGGHAVVVRAVGAPDGAHGYALLAMQHAQRVNRHFPDSILWAKQGSLAG